MSIGEECRLMQIIKVTLYKYQRKVKVIQELIKEV